MIYIQLADSIPELQISTSINNADLEAAARATLDFTNTSPDVNLTLVLSNDAQLHSLNLEYLEIDAPTDVLSFSSGELDPDTGLLYLGDIVISLERASAQAAAAGHPLESELRLLIVHGLLHLLGYDHAGEEEKAAMWSVQKQILAKLEA